MCERENGWTVRKKERKTEKQERRKERRRRFSLPNSTNLYRIQLRLIEQLNYPVNTISVSNTVPITAEHTACGHTHTHTNSCGTTKPHRHKQTFLKYERRKLCIWTPCVLWNESLFPLIGNMKVYCPFWGDSENIKFLVHESLAVAVWVFYTFRSFSFILFFYSFGVELWPNENKSNVKCVGRDRLMCLSSPAWLNIAHHYCQHREREKRIERTNECRKKMEWKALERRDRFRIKCVKVKG